MTDPGGTALPASSAGDGQRWSVPTWLVEDSLRFAESGTPPVTPRTAATVVLLRPAPADSVGSTGVEVYVQQRAATMAFAPSLYAFPGGSVDTRDIGAAVEWIGSPPAWWARRFGLPEELARAVVCAAVREVFEECGVLLAGVDESTVVADVSGLEWEAARVALVARDVSFTEMLTSRGLAVRADLLTPWARWLTPEFEPRRYDTFFFLARVPPAQLPRYVGGESIRTRWVTPAQAATLPMLPPTAHTLRQIATYDDVDSAMSAAAVRDLTTAVVPRLHTDDEGAWLIL